MRTLGVFCLLAVLGLCLGVFERVAEAGLSNIWRADAVTATGDELTYKVEVFRVPQSGSAPANVTLSWVAKNGVKLDEAGYELVTEEDVGNKRVLTITLTNPLDEGDKITSEGGSGSNSDATGELSE